MAAIVCETLFDNERGAQLRRLIEDATGQRCPCLRGQVCPLLRTALKATRRSDERAMV